MEQQEITVCAAIIISGPLVYHLIRWNVAVLAVCLPVRVPTTRRAEPTRLLSIERKSRAFISGRKIALAAGVAIAASLVCRQPRRPAEHGTREETWR